MRTLWAFGCSFTAPYFEWFNHDGSDSTYNKYKKYHNGIFPKTWSELLADRLEYKLENHGRGGGSNYWSFHNFCQVCKDIKEGDMVIFQWTHVERYIYHNHRELVNMSGPWQFDSMPISKQAAEEVYVNRSNLTFAKEMRYYTMLLDRMAELGKFDIFYWSACDIILNGEDDEYKKQDRFLQNESDKSLLRYLELKYPDIPVRIHQETNNEVSDAHYGKFGHQLMSDLFYDEITKKLQK